MKRRTSLRRNLLAVLLSLLCFSNTFNLLFISFIPSYASEPNIYGYFEFSDKSYDPVDEITNFSGRLDKVITEKNIWELYKYKDSTTGQILDEKIPLPPGSEVLNSGKYFKIGKLIEPGTYYVRLTVFDRGGNSDTTKSESFQITIPSQRLLVYATFDNPDFNFRAFEYDSKGEVKIQFKSKIQIRWNKQPKTIIYNWDFGDGQRSNEPNPVHTYKQNEANRDRVQYSPDLTVTAIWGSGYQESWNSKAGTVSIIDKPEFVALDILPDTTIGNNPLTVTFKISDKSFAKNATIVSYVFDFGDNSTPLVGTISNDGQTSSDKALAEIKQKTFTHTYTTKGEFSPALKVKIKENPNKEITFNIPMISTNNLLVSNIEVIEPVDNFVTNQPIQTFKIKSNYSNPLSDKNRLTIHVTDEENNETVTELDPGNGTQTISLSEGVNSYWFELIDSTGAIQKSIPKKIVLDTIDPSLELFSPGNEEVIKNGKLKIFGLASDENLDHIEYQTDTESPVNILQGDTEQVDENGISFYEEISNLVNGHHKLTVRAIDRARNKSEEIFDIGVGDGVFAFDKIISLRGSSFIPTFGGGYYKTSIGSPFKIQRNVWFFGDTVGKNDPSCDLTLSSKAIYNDVTANISDVLFSDYKEFLNTHFLFNFGDIDGFSLSPQTTFRSLPLNGNNLDASLYSSARFTNLDDPWDVGLHTIEISSSVTSPSGGVFISNTNNPNEITKELTKKYEILIDRPISTKSTLEPKEVNIGQETNFTASIEVTDPLGFNLTTKKLKLLLDRVTLQKPKNSQAQLSNLSLIPGSEEIDSTDNIKAKVKISFNLKPDILPSKDESYKLVIPIELIADNNHPLSNNDEKISIPIRVRGTFPAIIESPLEGEIVTSQSLVKAKLKGAANDISKFENQNVKFGLAVNGKEPIEIKANSGNNQIFRVNKNGLSGEDVLFSAKLNFDLVKLDGFKDLFLNKEALGLVDIYSTYTNTKDNITFDGDSHNLILLDNPEVLIKGTTLKKEKDKAALRLTLKNNTVLNNSDELLVKLTPYKDGDIQITGLDESFTKQTFSFTNQDRNPKLTQSRKILLPLETQKVKVEISRNDSFLGNIKKELPDTWKTAFIDKVRQEEKINRTYLVTLNNSLAADCDVIDSLLNKKLTNLDEINSLKKVAGCEVERIFFDETSKETDSIKLPFVSNDTATIPDDSTLGIKSVSFPFSDQLTLKDFKQLLKDLKLLAEDNNNGYDLETQEATYELLKIIDDFRCNKINILDSNLRSQVVTTFQCGISTGNYQDYILNSIKQDLPTVVWLKAIADILKPIGAQNPPVNLGLPDSLILRAIAIPVPGLPSWISVALGLGAYIVAAALNNQKTKLDYFEQVKDSTCTRVNGTIDRRFIIGKDLNNLDRMRTNTMAGISVDNSSTFKINVTEPFPHIPQYPGFYSTCLPQGTHTITLQFNGQNTFSMSVTIPRTSFPIFVEPFVGGVFRKYGKISSIEKVITSKTILNSTEGDVKTLANPSGAGAYLTNLSLTPGLDASSTDIAKALRLYSPGTFTPADPSSEGVLESERASAFTDLAIDTKRLILQSTKEFPLQFVLPNLPLHFGVPGENLEGIIIDYNIEP